MLSLNEYDKILSEVVNKLMHKKSKDIDKEILFEIKDLDESTSLCNNKEMTHSEVMYQVKYLKATYDEKLKEAMSFYQSIIFPDFSYKNDLNAMINGPYSLKIWLIRVVCLNYLKFDISQQFNLDIKNMSITRQYQEIDMLLFNKVLNVKVVNN